MSAVLRTMTSTAMSAKPGFDPFWLWQDVVQQAARLLDWGPKRGDPENPSALMTKVSELVTLIEFLTEQDADVGIFELMQIDMSSYVVAHHVQTVFLCGLIANKLGLPEARRNSLCRAAFTMNVSAMSLQESLSKQMGPITPEQKIQMTGHGPRSRALLQNFGVTDPDWLQAVQEHHPEILPAGQVVCELVNIIHHADIYLAKISPRAYRPAKTADLAAKELLTSPAADRRIVSILIKEFGIYPPGSYVALANGETAIVVRRREKAHTPMVYAISKGNVIHHTPVERDTALAPFAITGIVQRSEVKASINRAALLGYHHV